MRSKTPFPVQGEHNILLCEFLYNAWNKGWFDEYSDNHFLIQALENRLTTFVGKEQLIENNIDCIGMIRDDGSVDIANFNLNFCINFSQKMQFLMKRFGEENIKKFIKDQLSAGKKNYKENAFFEALSEVSVLSFYSRVLNWFKAIYEPTGANGDKKNPEARFEGEISCRMDATEKIEKEHYVTINIEVKAAEFPKKNRENERIAIPTMLLTEEGRKIVRDFCLSNDVEYLDPRVLKLRDFINSATSKFSDFGTTTINILYINWSYRDFPSNSFLEAWSLLTNEENGILTHPEIGIKLGINPEAYKKISAVVVYIESLEGLMFSDFRYVWQRNGVGPKFRMWVLDDDLRQTEWDDESNVLFNITGMNPSEKPTMAAMLNYASKTDEDREEAKVFGDSLVQLILNNVEK